MSKFLRHTPSDGFIDMEEDPDGYWVHIDEVKKFEDELAEAKVELTIWEKSDLGSERRYAQRCKKRYEKAEAELAEAKKDVQLHELQHEQSRDRFIELETELTKLQKAAEALLNYTPDYNIHTSDKVVRRLKDKLREALIGEQGEKETSYDPSDIPNLVKDRPFNLRFCWNVGKQLVYDFAKAEEDKEK